MQHHFDTDIAKEFGVNVAIFLDNIAYWTIKNIANQTHFHDDHYWTYNTVQAFTQLFPYWTTRQMRTIIDECLKKNLLIEGNYNQKKYDKTKWYALTNNGLKMFNLHAEIEISHSQSHLSELTNEAQYSDAPICASKLNTDSSDKNIITNDITSSPGSFVNSDKSSPDSFVRIDKPIPDRKHLQIENNIYMDMAKNSPNPDSMQIQDLLECNPFNISEILLSDWIVIRKSKNQIITITAWDTLNKELYKCYDPTYAFEVMVSNGWSMLNGDRFREDPSLKNKNKKSHFDNQSTQWADNIDKDVF